MSRYRLALTGCIALALVHGFWLRDLGPCDDEYIVYRYARNLAEGHGLVFNPGERVEGFTIPLWALILAAAHRAGVSPEAWSFGLSIVGTCAAVAAIGSLWRRLRPGARWPLPALLLALSPAMAFHAAFGLGTTLLAALLALWLWTYERDLAHERPAWRAALWLGLASLVRHEALLLAFPFLLAEQRRRVLGTALAALLPALAWAVFRWAYYGELLPTTWGVKKLPFFDDLAFGTLYLWESTLDCGIGLCLAVVLLHVSRRPQGATARRRRRSRRPPARRLRRLLRRRLHAHGALLRADPAARHPARVPRRRRRARIRAQGQSPRRSPR